MAQNKPTREQIARMIVEAPGNAPAYSFETIEPRKDSPLVGGRLAVLGSSVAFGAGSFQWAVGEYLSRRLGCDLAKSAVSGTTLADQGQLSYVSRLHSDFDPRDRWDAFVCQLSTNDATKGAPLGEVGKGRDLADFDVTTTAGAMEHIVCHVCRTWGCPVLFFTGSRFESAAYQQMYDLLCQVRDKWDIGVLDLWNNPAINDVPADQKALYILDGIHPTKAGYRDWWGPELERQLLAYLARNDTTG